MYLALTDHWHFALHRTDADFDWSIRVGWWSICPWGDGLCIERWAPGRRIAVMTRPLRLEINDRPEIVDGYSSLTRTRIRCGR